MSRPENFISIESRGPYQAFNQAPSEPVKPSQDLVLHALEKFIYQKSNQARSSSPGQNGSVVTHIESPVSALHLNSRMNPPNNGDGGGNTELEAQQKQLRKLKDDMVVMKRRRNYYEHRVKEVREGVASLQSQIDAAQAALNNALIAANDTRTQKRLRISESPLEFAPIDNNTYNIAQTSAQATPFSLYSYSESPFGAFEQTGSPTVVVGANTNMSTAQILDGLHPVLITELVKRVEHAINRLQQGQMTDEKVAQIQNLMSHVSTALLGNGSTTTREDAIKSLIEIATTLSKIEKQP